jgi:uncharacterized YccA/Bax inhibitor family protein
MATFGRTSNPALNDKTFEQFRPVADRADTMLLERTVHKCFVLVGIVLLAAAWTWNLSFTEGPAATLPWMGVGIIGGLVVAIVTVFKKHWASVTGPAYAVLEGLALGAISARFEIDYPGIAVQSVALTFGTLFCLLVAYKSKLILPSENFKLGVAAATGAIFFVYLINFVLGLLGLPLPYLNEAGWLGIGISLVIVVIAALNLVLDFDFIESGVAHQAPRYMEWYAAFALLVTLVWLYLEILRLLAKLSRRK